MSLGISENSYQKGPCCPVLLPLMGMFLGRIEGYENFTDVDVCAGTVTGFLYHSDRHRNTASQYSLVA